MDEELQMSLIKCVKSDETAQREKKQSRMFRWVMLCALTLTTKIFITKSAVEKLYITSYLGTTQREKEAIYILHILAQPHSLHEFCTAIFSKSLLLGIALNQSA